MALDVLGVTNVYYETFQKLLARGAYADLRSRRERGVSSVDEVIDKFSPNNVRRVILGLDGIYVQFYVGSAEFQAKSKYQFVRPTEQLVSELCSELSRSTPILKVLHEDRGATIGSRVFSSIEEIIIIKHSPYLEGYSFENSGLGWFIDNKEGVERSFKRLRYVTCIVDAIGVEEFIESRSALLQDEMSLVTPSLDIQFSYLEFNGVDYLTKTAMRPQYYSMDESDGRLAKYFARVSDAYLSGLRTSGVSSSLYRLPSSSFLGSLDLLVRISESMHRLVGGIERSSLADYTSSSVGGSDSRLSLVHALGSAMEGGFKAVTSRLLSLFSKGELDDNIPNTYSETSDFTFYALVYGAIRDVVGQSEDSGSVGISDGLVDLLSILLDADLVILHNYLSLEGSGDIQGMGILYDFHRYLDDSSYSLEDYKSALVSNIDELYTSLVALSSALDDLSADSSRGIGHILDSLSSKSSDGDSEGEGVSKGDEDVSEQATAIRLSWSRLDDKRAKGNTRLSSDDILGYLSDFVKSASDEELVSGSSWLYSIAHALRVFPNPSTAFRLAYTSYGVIFDLSSYDVPYDIRYIGGGSESFSVLGLVDSLDKVFSLNRASTTRSLKGLYERAERLARGKGD